jgi:hypothetical protein
MVSLEDDNLPFGDDVEDEDEDDKDKDIDEQYSASGSEEVLTHWIHGGVSIPTKETVCCYKVLCYLYMVMATDIYG